jgi:hypothetical protein
VAWDVLRRLRRVVKEVIEKIELITEWVAKRCLWVANQLVDVIVILVHRLIDIRGVLKMLSACTAHQSEQHVVCGLRFHALVAHLACQHLLQGIIVLGLLAHQWRRYQNVGGVLLWLRVRQQNWIPRQ